jgi:hypothetical protein
VSLYLGDLCKTALAFHKDVQRDRATTRDDEIILPVTQLLATCDTSRALADRNTLWNMGIPMGVAMSLELALPMGAW